MVLRGHTNLFSYIELGPFSVVKNATVPPLKLYECYTRKLECGPLGLLTFTEEKQQGVQ